jgi:KDO2-lipid IV(A) lauroyltransferase
MGHRIVHRRNAGPRLYKTLRRGGMIGLLVDLNSSIEEGGAFFDFFGVPALTTRSVGFLALKTGAPVVCSVARPQGNGRYRIEIGPEIPCDPAAPFESETDRITRCWLAECERIIRSSPEHWMWMYKRWKVRPTPDAARFPFYSFHDPKITAATAHSPH